MTTLQTPENALEQALVFLRRGDTEAAIGFATVAVQLLSSPEAPHYCVERDSVDIFGGNIQLTHRVNG